MKKTAAQLAKQILVKVGIGPGGMFNLESPNFQNLKYDPVESYDRGRKARNVENTKAIVNSDFERGDAFQRGIRDTAAKRTPGTDLLGSYARDTSGRLTSAGRAAANTAQPQQMAQNQAMKTQPAPSTGGYQGVQFTGDAASDMRETPNVKITRRGGGGGHKPPAQAKPGAGTLAKGTAQGASSKSPGALGGIGTLAAGFTDTQNQQSVAFAPSKARTPAASSGAGALSTGMTDATAFLRGAPGGGFNDPQSQQSVAFAPSKQRGNQAPAKPTSTLAQAKGKPRVRNMDFTTAGNFPDNFNPEDQNNYLASNNAPIRQRSIINPYDTRGQGALARRSGR